ncbi:MAG: DNA polymerase III subunit delta' [Gemmataceae bacterium]
MSWDGVKGHDAVLAGFRRVLRRGRLAHAYLFVGPDGVGKKRFAVEMARALLCERPPGELEACGGCSSCSLVEADTHPDLTVARRPEDKHEFPVELMRSLLANFALKPARGKGRVVIVDGADDFNEESGNAFLKTLEEPPPGSLLILIGFSPERQLATVVSRCQVVRFGPLSDDTVRAVLTAAEVEPRLTERLVRLAEGSPGRALELSDPALWEFRSSFLTGLLKKPIDAPELSKAWMAFVEEAGKEPAQQRGRARAVLGLVVDVLADALRAGQGCGVRRTGPEDAAAVEALAKRFDGERLMALIDRAMEAEAQIDRRVQLVLGLEAFLDAVAQRSA